jgi:hypothetical protein
VSLEPCPYCKRADFPSKDARRMHVLRCRRKDESMPTNKIDQIFERFGKPKYDKMFQEMTGREEEKSKSTESKVIATPKKISSADILRIYEEQAEIVRFDLIQGKIKYEVDAIEELKIRLLASGMTKETVNDFARIFKNRLIAERVSSSQPKQVIQAQPQPQPREPTLDEMASLEAERINRQRGYSQLIERNWACEICGRGNMTREEAVSCEQSHQMVTTTQKEPETPSQQEPEVVKPREISQSQPRPLPQALPQSDAVIKGIKSLLGRIVAPQKQKETKTEEQTQPQEEAYSPITYMNTVRWQAPEPIESQECKICGRIDYISNFRAGLHGHGVCN